MDGLMQSASVFIIGALLVYLGVGVAKDLARVTGIAVATAGLAIAGLAISALADYPLWQAVLAVFMLAGIWYAVVSVLVAKVPHFQLHPDSEE